MPLEVRVAIDNTTWAALALVLTLLGAGLSVLAWRRRGLTAGLRGLAWTLVPVAAWLTGTLRLAANIVGDVAAWGAGLVFSPTVWLGITIAGIAAVLWVVSGFLRARGIGVRGQQRGAGESRTKPAAAARLGKKSSRPPGARSDDLDDLDDIEAILKRHGI